MTRRRMGADYCPASRRLVGGGGMQTQDPLCLLELAATLVHLYVALLDRYRRR
jgi:hypothetical protein